MPDHDTLSAVQKRFVQYVDYDGPIPTHRPDLGACWLWRGARYWNSGGGYGGFWLNGHTRLAHRVAYQLWVGPIPQGLHLDHICHNGSSCPGGDSCAHRRCVNPQHLEPVTREANVLRGHGITAKNLVKTHCPANHPLTPENTYVYRGKRSCRRCHALREIVRKTRLRSPNNSQSSEAVLNSR